MPGIVLSLGKAKDFQITVPFMNSYQNLYPDKKEFSYVIRLLTGKQNVNEEN